MSTTRRIHDLVRSSGSVELRETHISWVLMTERDVFKVKKPVRFSFLDFGTIEARKRACDAEVVLNRRLAPTTYLGVVPVRRDHAGRLRFGGDGEIVDWAVHMRRLPDASRADERLRDGTLAPAHLDALAELVASFHDQLAADPRIAHWGSPSSIAHNVEENFAEVNPARDDYLSPAQAIEVETWQLDVLAMQRYLFEDRVAAGRVRDGHGDLRLEHVYFGDDGTITILDCIEFDDRFRCADVCADVAFLSMDLAAHGRVDLAERFLAKYARAANDFDLYGVVDFYESYRAYVRGKISAIRARTSEGAARADAEADARRHFALALAAHRRPVLRPAVVAIGGLIATGKSTVAEAVADRMSAPVVDADRTRKHLLGIGASEDAHARPFAGAYDPAITERVYDELLRRAACVLRSGRPVVLDASFRSARMRKAARDLARKHGVAFSMVECRARPEVCYARLARRQTERSVSDARSDLFAAFKASFEPMVELPAGDRIVVNTERPLEENMRTIEASLETWPHGLVA